MRSRLLLLGCALGLSAWIAWAVEAARELPAQVWAGLTLAGLLGWALRGREVSVFGALELGSPFVALAADGGVLHANDGAYEIFGLARRDDRTLEARMRAAPPLRDLLADLDAECGELFTGAGDAPRRCFEVRISRPDVGSDGMRVLTFHDVTARRASQQELYHMAHFDSLTGLPNRRFSHKHLETAVAHSRQTGIPLALISVDLDRFKVINDSLGHAAGDSFLRIIAQRLRQHLRTGDHGGLRKVTLARLGGDEFVVASHCPGGRADAKLIAERMLRVLEEPVLIEGRMLRSGGSAGIALYPTDGEDADAVMRAADVALYHAKSLGRGNFQFFDAELTELAQRKALVESLLRKAISTGELELHFQPKHGLPGGALRGAEALLRWESPELGRVAPREFIPLAEEFGLILPLGDWVIDRVCGHLAEWRRQGLELVPISVNVSPLQLAEENLDDRIATALRRHELEAHLLEIELTESAILENDGSAVDVLRSLRSFGVRISLDDFGSGYSSLSYLNRIPIDVLKLDRNFLRDLHLDPSAEGVVAAVISMAHSLKLDVVAEGVACDEQIEILTRIGCDMIQGFASGPPMSEPEFRAQLAAARPSGRFAQPAPAPDPSGAGWGEASILVLGDGRGSFGVLAIRLNRIGAPALYARTVEDGMQIAGEADRKIGAVMCGASADPGELRPLLDRIEVGSEGVPSVLVVASGKAPDAVPELRVRHRIWVIREPVDDASLRGAVHAALEGADRHSRSRSEPRAPVDITAGASLDDRRASVLLSSLSRHGAFLESERLPEIGSRVGVSFSVRDAAVSVEARVLYHVLHGPGTGARGFGVCFDSLVPDAADAIEGFVRERALRRVA